VSTFRLLARTFPTSSHDWHVQPFVKDQLAFRLSGAPSVRPDSTMGIWPSSKPFKANRFQNRCQPAEITGFPPVFNSPASLDPVWDAHCLEADVRFAGRRALLQRARKRSSAGNGQKSAHAETEDDSKLKDRLEVLLYAETLQGTLSPNANPGKKWG